MKRVTITVAGRVQGIFFRNFVQKRGTELGLKGYVRNLSHDKVEVVAEGDKAALEKLIQLTRKGPQLSNVLKCDVQYSEPTGEFKLFSIRY